MSEIVFDEKLFLKLITKAEVLWFKGMLLFNDTITKQFIKTTKEPIFIIEIKKVFLKKENVGKNKDDINWEALPKHFNLE